LKTNFGKNLRFKKTQGLVMEMIFENEVEQTVEVAFESENDDHGDEDADELDRLVPYLSSAPKRILIADDQTINIQVLTAKF
jgi:hypothetical protein